MAKQRRRRRSGWLTRIPVFELQKELSRRRGQVTQLQRQHDRLADELGRVRAELEALGGDTGDMRMPGRRRRGRPPGIGVGGRRGRRRRPRNTSTLVDALADLLKGKTMSVTDIAQAVQSAGYKTSAANFRTIVNQTLINSGKFKRTGRGQYTTK